MPRFSVATAAGKSRRARLPIARPDADGVPRGRRGAHVGRGLGMVTSPTGADAPREHSGTAQVPASSPNPGVAALSPDGRTVVFAAMSDGATRLYRRPVDGFRVEAIEGSDDATYPFFSPDGAWVAYFTRARQLRKVSLAGGKAITIIEIPFWRSGAAWRRRDHRRDERRAGTLLSPRSWRIAHSARRLRYRARGCPARFSAGIAGWPPRGAPVQAVRGRQRAGGHDAR